MAELPPPAVPAPLTAPIAEITGDSHHSLFTAVCGLAVQSSYRVAIADTGRADGTCNRQTRQITIAKRLAPNGQLAAGIHELAHALVGDDAEAPKLTYAQEELVVELVAWSCCQTVGLDTSANSIPYLTSWAQTASLEVLEHTAALTDRLCDRIERALLPSIAEPDTTSHPVAAAAAA